MVSITTKTLQSIQPKSTPYFIRDSRVKGFALKLNPSGRVKFIAETWQDGRSIRKILGSTWERLYS
jgi:hypothetical protein